MNRRQKSILINFVIVIIVTIVAVLAMVNFKDGINRSEAIRAVTQLGQIVMDYRREYGSVPPESYVDNIKATLEGRARLGDLKYRGRWINFDCSSEEVLAYTECEFRSLFFSDGYVVLRFNGDVEWMDKEEFEALLNRQQGQLEKEMLERKILKK